MMNTQAFSSRRIWYGKPRRTSWSLSGPNVCGESCPGVVPVIAGSLGGSCNKGDELHPEIRCRLVAQELKTLNAGAQFYVAIPPAETLRRIPSYAAESAKFQVGLVDT